MTHSLGDHLLPTEEELGIDGVEPGETLVRAHIGRAYRLCNRRATAFELGIVGEDRRLESLQLRARLDPELTHQHLPGAGEDLKCFGLTPGSVEGDHQLAPSPLPHRLFANHRLELRDEPAWIFACESRVDEIFGGHPSKLVEPVAFRRPEPRIPVALVGGASPPSERLLEPSIGL